MGARNIMIRAGADFSALTAAFQAAGIQAVQFEGKMKHSFASIGLTLNGIKMMGEAVLGTMRHINEFASEAGEMDGRMSSLERRLGSSTDSFIQWGDTVGKQMGLSKQQVVEIGASVSAMIMPIANSTSQLSALSKTMMKDMAITSAGTGFAIDDVQQRFISALAGNPEALKMLDINVMESAIIHSEAYKKISGGAPWAQLTAEQRQAILVTQLHKEVMEKFGSEVMEDTATQMNRFHAALSDIKYAFIQAFQPIMYAVLPAITAFINGITRALQVMVAFFQVLFGYSGYHAKAADGAKKETDAIGDLAAQHGKLAGAKDKSSKAGKSTAGFDQVHTLSDGSGGAGSSGDMNIGGMDTHKIIDDGKDVEASLESMRVKMAKTVEDMKVKFAGLSKFFTDHKVIIVTALAGIGAAFTTYFVVANWGSIVSGVTLAIEGLGAAFAVINLPILAIAVAIGAVVAILVHLWMTNKEFRDSVIEVWTEISKFATKVFNDMWEIIKNTWDKYGKDIWTNIKGIFKQIEDVILSLWNKTLKPILMDGISKLRKLWDEHFKGMFSAIADFVGKAVTAYLELYNKVILPIIKWLVDKLGPIFTKTFKGISGDVSLYLGVVGDLVKDLFKVLGGIIDFLTTGFKGDWKGAWKGLTAVFVDVWNGLKGTVYEVLNWMITKANNMIDGINSATKNVPAWMGGGYLAIDHISTFPKLAKGGITNGAMMAMIGDNAGGKEVVSPLSDLRAMMAETVSAAVSGAMAFHGGSGNQGGDIIMTIDGRQFARIAKSYLDNEDKRVGTNVRLKPI